MGANSTRVPHILVSNVAALNTGTTAATAVNNDVLLLNKAGVLVADAGTLINNFDNDVVRIALGTSATAGVVKWSSPIHVRGISKVTTLAYELPVQHRVVLSAASVPTVTPAGTVFSIKVQYHDTHQALQDRETSQYFTYTTLAANESSTTVYAGLKAKIDAVTAANQQIAATAAATLTLDGIAVVDNALGLPQFRYFEVFMRKGFTYTAGASIVVTAGKPGRGIANQVKQTELGDKYNFNRTQFPVDTDTRRASDAVVYNCVVITHNTPHLSNLHTTYQAPETTVIWFAGGDSTTNTTTAVAGAATATVAQSAKQVAFMTKLNSLVESAGVFVQ